ncbi:DUF1992 domain-containing protein [Psychromicrobium lacuslunae]|uniref:DnaJ family domain-containing protein n=1 Tax=Psychromicrobium lacuslunae TaxID=1618207 RepID=UPI000695EC3F|nr:DUF1992 domain-containing protein [Psychromicrobium lacuslunae]
MGRKERAELLKNIARRRVAREAARHPAEADSADLNAQADQSVESTVKPEIAPQQSIRNESVRANIAVEQAIARGDFDNLALAGKPLPNSGPNFDPDWWLKGLIQREQLSGLGPPALMLRKEDAELDALLDRQVSEKQIRELIEDFNRRVVEARRQLLGGPPVVTKTRDVETEIARWRQRRATRG